MTGLISENKIKAKIEELLESVGAEKSICPSEVARALSSQDWRTLMSTIRKCADEMKKDGVLQIMQKGRKIESAQEAKGPIRLKTNAQ